MPNPDPELSPTRKVVYKQIDGVELELHLFEPAGHKANDARPGVVFFFGGGWQGGAATHFYPQATHLAKRGIWVACADYRIHDRHGVQPYQCVADGRSAVRWVRAHAQELGVDPKRLAAGGGSAGGHVAACTAFVEMYDEPDEDQSISARPDALVLFNPVYDVSVCTQMAKYPQLLGEKWETISPAHHVRPGLPPTLLQVGSEDQYFLPHLHEPVKRKMAQAGNRFELICYPGEPHGFFNPPKPCFEPTVAAMDRFLDSIGFGT